MLSRVSCRVTQHLAMMRLADYKPRVDRAAQGGGHGTLRRTRGAVRVLALAGVALVLALAAAAPPAAAADSPDSSVPAQVGPPAEPRRGAAEPQRDDATIAAGLMISPAAAARQRRAVCDEARRQGEIVVCGADRGEQWRVPSTADSDPASRQGQDTGVPRAPDVSGLPDCSRGCVGFGRVPPPVYVVDFSKLPEAPAGSDADRIAKGEAPTR